MTAQNSVLTSLPLPRRNQAIPAYPNGADQYRSEPCRLRRVRRAEKGLSPPSVSAPCGHRDRADMAPLSENDMNTKTTTDVMLPWSRVRERVGLGRNTCARLQRLDGEMAFPKPIRLSPGRVAWREADVQAWIEARAAAVQS